MTAIQERCGCDPRHSKSITATYEYDLQWVNKYLAERFDMPTGEHRKTLNDAINNTWWEGITIEVWAYAAARRAGLWAIP